MTIQELRSEFAKAAMQGLLASPTYSKLILTDGGWDALVDASYNIADKMLTKHEQYNDSSSPSTP